MLIQIKYLNETKNIEINDIHKRIGYIQEDILNIFTLMIYNIEYTKLVHKNGTIYLGKETEINEDDTLDTSYICYFDIMLKNYDIKMEDILYFEIEDRHRDENGNVIKNNKYIDNYNKFLTKKSEDEYDSYFETMIQRNTELSQSNPMINLLSIPLNTILPSIPMSLNRVVQEETNSTQEANSIEEDRNVRAPLTSIENNLINTLMNQLAEEFQNEVSFEDEIEDTESMEEDEAEVNIFAYSSNDYRNENLPNLPTHVSHLFGMLNSPYNVNPLTVNSMNHNLFDFNHSFRMRYQFSNNLRNIFNGTLGPFGSTMNDIKVTLTEEEYNNIETTKYNEYENNEKCKMCIICNDEFKEDDIIKITKCKHVLHDECLKPWLLKESKKCPVCRMELGEGKAHIDEEETKEDENQIDDVE